MAPLGLDRGARIPEASALGVLSGTALVRGGMQLRLRDKLGQEQWLPRLKSVQAAVVGGAHRCCGR
jgi:hypothetical protein